jgi:hypothetical protein
VIENRSAEGKPATEELRCCCGSLLARRTSEGVELRCRRCRRTLLLILDADGGVALVEGASGRAS